METFLLIAVILLSIVCGFLSWKLYIKSSILKDTSTELDKSGKKYRKLLSQKKSSEVRLGQISEKLAPFLDDFDFNPKHLTFLGNPIDYVHFGENEITFIEVKSGKSKLSSKQRKIRDLILNGNINWHIFRIK